MHQSHTHGAEASEREKRAKGEALSSLRARLRRVTLHRRERACGVVVAHRGGPALVATGHAGAWECKWTGVQTCGHIWTCPVCSLRIRNDRCARVLRALKNAGGRWQLVTLTLSHHAGDSLARLERGLASAWRRTRQGGEIQALWSENVSASVRATEITWSHENGWHPHLHVILRTPEWSEDDRAALFDRFRACVVRELGERHAPNIEHGIVWSDPLELCKGLELDESQHRLSRYLFKLGLEIAGFGKTGKRTRTSWQLAELAASGDDRAKKLWWEFQAATRGRRMIEMDDRAARFAKMPDPDRDETVHDSTIERVEVPILANDLRMLRWYERRHDSGILAHVLSDVSRSKQPGQVVNAWLALVSERLEYARENGETCSNGTPLPAPWSQAWRSVDCPGETIYRVSGYDDTG